MLVFKLAFPFRGDHGDMHIIYGYRGHRHDPEGLKFAIDQTAAENQRQRRHGRQLGGRRKGARARDGAGAQGPQCARDFAVPQRRGAQDLAARAGHVAPGHDVSVGVGRRLARGGAELNGVAGAELGHADGVQVIEIVNFLLFRSCS